MAVLDFKLNGERIIVDTDDALPINDPDAERSMVAAHIAHWGMVLASADCAHARTEAGMDHWFGKAVVELLKADPKLSEWKAKEMVKGHSSYLEWANGVADSKMVADKVRAVYAAYSKKHEMLKAMADRERGQPSGQIGRTTGNDSRFDTFKQNRSGR